jgi:ketosteroid isomerase-like protein
MPSSHFHRHIARGAAALAAIVALACGGDPVRDAIEAEIEKGVNSVRNKDLSTYIDQIPDATLGNDSASIQRGRDAVREAMREEWLATTTQNLSVDIESVKAGADTAIVESTMHWSRIIRRQEGADTVISRVKHRELWRLTPKGWRSFEVLWMSGEKTTNGKVEHVGQ